MVLTKIPHFREVMVCSFECPHCGNRSVSLPDTASSSMWQPGPCMRHLPVDHTGRTRLMPGGSGRNNELQFAGTYGETGVRYTLALPAGDMDARSRQVWRRHDTWRRAHQE